jgi:membrane protein
MQQSIGAPPGTQSSPVQPHFVIIEPGWVARSFWLLRRAFIAAYEDNCFSIAKGAAYSFFLSLFPVLTTLTSILILANARAVVQVIVTFVRQFAPPGAEDILLSRLRDQLHKPIQFSVFAVGLSLWAGSGAMISLMEGFQAAYRIPSGRPFLKQRAMAVFLVIVTALPAVGASALILFGSRVEAAFNQWIGVGEISGSVDLLWRLAEYVLAFCTTTLVTGLLYYFGPNYRQEPAACEQLFGPRFLRVWPGAFVATLLWTVATAGFALYVHHANYNFFYGSVGTVIVLLIWLYLIACIALIGCEFNAERERIALIPFES